MQQKTQYLQTPLKLHCITAAGFQRPASEYLNVTGDNDHNPQMKTYLSSLHVHKGYLAIQAALNYSTCPPVPSRETEKLGEREQNGMTCSTQPHTIHHPQGGCEGQQSLNHQRILLL